MGHQRGQLDQAFDAAQAFGQGEQARAAGHLARSVNAALDLERQHAAEAADHLATSQFVLRMAFQARVVDVFHARVVFQEATHLQRVGGVLAHAHRQGLESAQHQPTVERPGHSTDRVLQKLQAIVEVIVGRDQRATDDVRMSAHVFGRAVVDDVRAEVERSLAIRAGKSVVDGDDDVALVGQTRHRSNVDQLQQRVGRTLEPDQFGAVFDGVFDVFYARCIDKRET